jgi:fumarate hydratase subunit beta
MSEPIKLTTPLSDDDVKKLKIGDKVSLNGIIYTGRDVVHKRLVELVDQEKPLPFDIKGQIIYYVGPSPAKPGQVIGSAGPTTSYRMDAYSPKLISIGLKAMIGKGKRGREVIDALVKYKAVYFAAVGGAGALIQKTIKKAEVIAYEEMGPEALRRLEVEEFPVIVVNDIYGEDLYQKGMEQYRRE